MSCEPMVGGNMRAISVASVYGVIEGGDFTSRIQTDEHHLTRQSWRQSETARTSHARLVLCWLCNLEQIIKHCEPPFSYLSFKEVGFNDP